MSKVLIHRELKKKQVDISSIEQTNYSIYTHDPNDFLINGMLELLDQYQRLEIALKLSRGRKKKAEQGGYAGGGTVYGYSIKKGQKHITINSQQALAVKRLFQLKRKHPRWTLTQFGELLNNEGHRTASHKLFTKVQIKRILDHRAFYKGNYQYGKIQSKGKYEPISL